MTPLALVREEVGPVDHRLWGGRFSAAAAPAFDALNSSIALDLRLWPYDVKLSKAWAMALWQAGVLTLEESEQLAAGLEGVSRRLAAGEAPAPTDEDVHTLIDRLLHEEVGEVASKLHTGRSRNDQAATATRMWTIEACSRLDEAVRALERALVDQATGLGDVPMPAYTHLQRAQPIAAAHWLLGHFWPLERDRIRLSAAARTAGVLPLGAGAVAGCAFPVSRTLLQGTLGFAERSRNSVDAVSDRDFVAEVLFALGMLGVHLSRLAEDLIIYGTAEFGFVRFADEFSSGSSMMPQKRNPDALELARGFSARFIGELTAFLVTLKGLPSGYNKDLQEDKRALFGAVDAALLLLPAVAGAVATLRFAPERMRAALGSAVLATDLADYLVRKGVAFRDAHAAVGRLVLECERADSELHELSLASFTAAHPAFGPDVFDALSVRASVERRDVDGGTGPAALHEQLEAAKTALARAEPGTTTRRTPVRLG